MLRSEHTCATFQPAKSQKALPGAKPNCLSKGRVNSLASFGLFTGQGVGCGTLQPFLCIKEKERDGEKKKRKERKKARRKKLARHLPFQCPEGSISFHLFRIIIMASQLLKRAPVHQRMVHDTAKPWALSHQLPPKKVLLCLRFPAIN